MAVRAQVTLCEILEDVPPEKLDQPCKDKHLCYIARGITNWVLLTPFLQVEPPESEAIRGKWPFNIPAQNLELLIRWKHKHQRKGKDTYRNLRKAFLDAQEVTLADRVNDVLYSEINTSDSSPDESDYEEPTMPMPIQPVPLPDQKGEASSPSTQSVHAGSIANPLEDLALQLRMSYRCRPPSFVVLQWPPPPTLKVFNLAMIHSKEIIRRMPLDEYLVRLTMRGSVDDIMRKKTAVELEDLFRSGGNVILVEGAPGAGKSTMSWDIVLKWVAQEMFHDEFKVVVYVQFRDLNEQSAIKIADLLPLGLKSRQRKGATAIVDCYGDGVLFVLDGWDEYSPGLQHGSLIQKLICFPQDLGIPKRTVLITSRPIASGQLQPHASSRVEIVGFMPDEVCRYFGDVFKDSVTVQKLYDHLKKRPVVEASCYLPLNAAIVAHLFMELNYNLPTTLHGLFCSLVLSCIIRHLTKESKTQPAIRSLDELPPDVQEVFENICILAYKGTMNKKVVFSNQDLCSFGLPENLSTLSLLQVVQSFATGKPSSYHFLHLSIQELLTALYISKLLQFEQVRIFTELFGQPRFDAVFHFYAAFTKLQNEGIRDIISPMISLGEKEHLPNLMQCLYEAQDTSLCHFVSSQLQGILDLSSTTLSPLDLISLKYFLSCVNSSGAEGSDSDNYAVTVSDLRLELCNLIPEDINSLSLHSLLRVDLDGNRVSCACAANLLTNSRQLKHLSLSYCEMTDDGVYLFAAALKEHQTVKHLYLSRCTDSTHVTHHILQAVLNHSSLQYLNITYCPLAMKDIAAVLKMNDSLREMAISRDGIPDSHSVVFGYSLMNNKTLERLVVNVDIRPSSIEKFVWNLRDCHLKSLIVHGFQGVPIVSRELMDQVDDIRRACGLPLLKVMMWSRTAIIFTC